MANGVLGRNGTIRLYSNGQLQALGSFFDFECKIISELIRTYPVGEAISRFKMATAHITGSFMFEFETTDVFQFWSTLLAAIKTGTAYPQIVLTVSVTTEGGVTSSMNIVEVGFPEMGVSITKTNEKITVPFTFEANDMVPGTA